MLVLCTQSLSNRAAVFGCNSNTSGSRQSSARHLWSVSAQRWRCNANCPGQSCEEAAATVSDCLTLAADGNPDALLEHVPDGVLDRCIAQRKSARVKTPGLRMTDLTFEDIVKTSHKKEFACDAYGQRSLIFFPLQEHMVLSSMLVAPDKFVQRCAIQNSTLEQAILTFELILQECLQPSYKGVNVVNRWMLQTIHGESAVIDQLAEPHPSLSPDAVVLAQLHSLRWGLESSFATPASQASKGRFGFPTDPAQSISLHYMPLFHHTSAQVTTVVHSVPLKATVVLEVTPDEQYIRPSQWQIRHLLKGQLDQQHVFLWSMALQTSGPRLNCWMTEHVQYTRPIDGVKRL